MKSLYIALFLCVLVGTACEKTNLDDYPEGKVTTTQTTKSYTDSVSVNGLHADINIIRHLDDLLMAPQAYGKLTVRYEDVKCQIPSSKLVIQTLDR